MPHVLVIDDDSRTRAMYESLLEREQCTVVSAENGKAALKHLDHDEINLVITDIVMPEMEGLELISHLRNTQPDLPVIAVSGGAHIGPTMYLLFAEKFGARYAFEKPVNPAELLAAVRDCLGRDEGDRVPGGDAGDG